MEGQKSKSEKTRKIRRISLKRRENQKKTKARKAAGREQEDREPGKKRVQTGGADYGKQNVFL